jgi:hypothetical protein
MICSVNIIKGVGEIMSEKKFEFTRNQRFLRGLLFLSTGVFLLLRFAGNSNNVLLAGAAWFAAIVALCALILFLWSVYAGQ